MKIIKVLNIIGFGLIILFLFGELFIGLYFNFTFLDKYFYSGEDDKISELYNVAAQLQISNKREEALSIYEEIESRSKKEFGFNSPEYLRSKIFLSDIYFELGSYEFSQKYAESVMQKTITVIQTSDEDSKVKTIKNKDWLFLMNILGKVYKQQGKYSEMENVIQFGYSLVKDKYEPSHPLRINYLNNIGILYTDLYDYKKANFYLSQLEDICPYNKKSQVSCSAVYNSLGILNFHSGDFNKSLHFFKLSLELLNVKNLKVNTKVSLHHNIANSLIALNQIDEAEIQLKLSDSLSQTANLSLSEIVQLKNSFIELYQAKGEFNKAKNYLKQSLSIQESGSFKNTLDLAHTLAKAAVLSQKEEDFKNSYIFIKEALKNVRIHFEENLRYTTQETRLQAIDILFKQQDILISFLERTDSVINKSKGSITTEIFNNTIYRKGLSFRTYSQQQNAIKNITDSLGYLSVKEIRRMEDSLQQAIFSNSLSEQELNNLKIEVESFKTMLFQSSFSSKFTPIAKEINLPSNKYNLNNVKNGLGEGDLYIEIVKFNNYDKGWTDNSYYIAMIVDSNKDSPPAYIKLGNTLTLEGEFFKTYHQAIRKKIKDEDSFDKFLGKISPYLVDKNKVYFSLDGIYHKISLRSLLIDKNNYLGDIIQIRRVSNGRIPTKEKIDNDNRIVLFGDPLFKIPQKTGWVNSLKESIGYSEKEIPSAISELRDLPTLRNGIGSLPYTKNEVVEIEKLLKDKWTIIKLLEENASKENLKQVKSPTILHFATHGFFIEQEERNASNLITSAGSIDPMFSSGLLLAGASNTLEGEQISPTDNGILTAYEVINLDLKNTDLVVLSACETGLGDIKNGEGVIGLQRAFQIAGAKNVLMSLWKVDDEATKKLMVLFYKNLSLGMNKHEALNHAQLSLRENREYGHPFYWAGFVLSSI